MLNTPSPTSFTNFDLEVAVEYAFTPEEPQTRDYPGAAAEFEITSVSVEVPPNEPVDLSFPEEGPVYEWLVEQVKEKLTREAIPEPEPEDYIRFYR
jgi:hypothetical protein